jgi:ATP-dependent protease ClpP protease subunit
MKDKFEYIAYFMLTLVCIGMTIFLVSCVYKFAHTVSKTHQSKTFYMVEEISDKTALRFKQFIDKAIEDKVQVVDIKLETDGGSIVAGQSIVSDMRRFPGWINVVVSGRAASMGGIITCYADGIVKDDNAIFLYHTMRSIVSTPLGEIITIITEENIDDPITKAQYHLFKSFMNVCDKFLTTEQREAILSGEDVVILGKDLKEYKDTSLTFTGGYIND